MAIIPDQPQAENKPAAVIEISPSILQALNQILSRMKQPEMFIQLADLIKDVADDTGFGDVKVVIVDSFAQLLKAEKSYK